MNRSVFIIAFIAIGWLVSSAYAQSEPSWQKAVSADERFEILFPGAFAKSVKQVTTPDGIDAALTTYKLAVGDAGFIVNYWDFTRDLPEGQAQLVARQKGFLSGTGAELVWVRESIVEGNHARVFKAVSKDKLFKFTVFALVVGRRLYSIEVAQPLNDPLPEQDRFFRSFKLTSPVALRK